jgi:uncharacterized protein with HEPN domain
VKSDSANLSTILERIERARRFTRGGKDEFLQSELIQDAVIWELEVIGEATKRLSRSTRALDPKIPWSRMAGFKDVAIHQYDKLNIERVWNLVNTDLRGLGARVRAILTSIGAHRNTD